MQKVPSEGQVTKWITDTFTKETGLTPAEISHCYPFDRRATVHTEDRTFELMLTYGGHVKKGSIEEDKP